MIGCKVMAIIFCAISIVLENRRDREMADSVMLTAIFLAVVACW